MKKPFFFLILLLFPAFVYSTPLSEQALLRETIPINALGYARIPNPWGFFASPKETVLKKALANKQHVQQIQSLENSVYHNLLTKTEIFPGLTLLFHHLRSPVEVLLLFLDGVPSQTNGPKILFSAKLNFTSIAEINLFLKKLVAKTAYLEMPSHVSTEGYGILKVKQERLFLHYDLNTQTLSLLTGFQPKPNQAMLQKILSEMATVKQHPMYFLENQIDASHQGFFVWLNLKTILPLYFQHVIPPKFVPALRKWGLDKVRAVAAGWGVREGKGRLSLKIDAPSAGYRDFFPPISNRFSVKACGKPGIVASISIPALTWLQGAEKVLQQETSQSIVQFYQNTKQSFKNEFGFSLEEMLHAFGSEMLFFSDEVGEFVAVRLGDKNKVQKILFLLMKKYPLAYEKRQLDGKEYHHLVIPTFLTPQDKGTENEQFGLILTLFSKLSTHYYWVEEDGYFIFAKVPQLLIDRQRSRQERVSIQQWLQQEQHQDSQSSLLMASASLSDTPRYLYYAYLQMLNYLADLATTKIDLFTLPTAMELNLPKHGTYGLQVDIAEPVLSLELTFENNPVEFLLSQDSITSVAVIGILAALAIPALVPTEQAISPTAVDEKAIAIDEAVSLLESFKTPAQEYFAIFDRLPTAEEVKDIWEIKKGSYTHIRLLDAKDGYSVEFVDIAISGKLINRYQAKTDTWICTHEGMAKEYLPENCK